jgi:hypothetical protein
VFADLVGTRLWCRRFADIFSVLALGGIVVKPYHHRGKYLVSSATTSLEVNLHQSATMGFLSRISPAGLAKP